MHRSLEVDRLGYQAFTVANADMSVATTTTEIRARFYAGVEQTRPMRPDETFYSIDKARELLDRTPQNSWRDVLPDPRAGN